MRCYEYRHTVGFEETNLVGNVYYLNYLRWQGRCREMFLRDHAPGVLENLRSGLCLVTTRVECDMYEEVDAFDVVCVRMRLVELGPSLIVMGFEYAVEYEGRCRVVASGQQQIRCARRTGGGLVGCEVPRDLAEALRPFARQG